MVRVRVENLVKRFGNKSVVNDVSLEIRDKEFFVLLGPSGCGKTTTLNIIAGLEEVSEGKIFFDDQVVNDLPPEKRNVAMVFQGFTLYPHMSAYDNIAFTLKMHKVPQSQIESKVKEAASILQITELMQRRPHQMSGGERQRVALARAIVRNPSVFLLDEPMSNIDAKLRVEMRTELIRLHKELSTTMIYVTHDQVEALSMADRIAVMNKGKVLQVGEPLTVFHKPVSLLVGGFIGSPPMNFIDCSLSQVDSPAVLITRAFAIEIPHDMGKAVQQSGAGADLVLGIRPYHVEISRQHDREKQIESKVYAVQPLGNETLVDLDAGGIIVKGVTPGDFPGQIGEKAWMSFNEAGLHVFDKKTGAAIV